MSGEFYIICYDSPSNKRRTKLHKLLKNYAVPVQKSVFETFFPNKFNFSLNSIVLFFIFTVNYYRYGTVVD